MEHELVIEARRTEGQYWRAWLSMVAMALLLASGIWYFRRMERTFAGVI